MATGMPRYETVSFPSCDEGVDLREAFSGRFNEGHIANTNEDYSELIGDCEMREVDEFGLGLRQYTLRDTKHRILVLPGIFAGRYVIGRIVWFDLNKEDGTLELETVGRPMYEKTLRRLVRHLREESMPDPTPQRLATFSNNVRRLIADKRAKTAPLVRIRAENTRPRGRDENDDNYDPVRI